MKLTLKSIALAACAAFAALPAAAEGEFAEGSTAKEWGVLGEEKALFSGKVVDILCELSGNCADNCGNGDRQLGILRDADNALVPVGKNSQPAFSGAVLDLLPYCNQQVTVDGVLVGDPEMTPAKFYLVQRIQPEGGEWAKANQWTKLWSKAHPEFEGVKGPWFRKDARIKAQIEQTGWLGLGHDADKAFIKDWYGE